MEKVVTCLVPGCESTPTSRGLCFQHYQKARRLVKRGKITMGELEDQGKILKSKKPREDDFFLDGKKQTKRITE